jgi:hypothetical protein
MPDFFENVDSLGIVENHIQEVLKLEERQARQLLTRYKEVRQELRDRLDYIPEGTFTSQRLRGVLVQVEAAIAAMSSSLKTGMNDLAKESALKGVDHQLAEIRKFDKEFLGAVTPIDVNRVLVMEETNNFLLNKYESSIDAYGQDLISQITSTLSTQALMEAPLSTVVRNLGRFFQGEEWKLHRIARTEFHGVYNIAKMKSMSGVRDDYLPDLQKTLIHPMDARTGDDSKLLARKNPIVGVDEPFKYTYKGKVRVFMAPPDRPNDRAILVPYRQVWEK